MSEANNKIPAVPKFTSFRPKSDPGLQKAERLGDAQRQGNASSRSRHRHDLQNSGQHRNRSTSIVEPHNEQLQDKRTLFRHGSASAVSQSASISFSQGHHVDEAEVGLKFTNAPNFTIDIAGDPRNVEFGSNHKYSIPTHVRTAGEGAVLGLSRERRILFSESTEKTTVLGDGIRRLGNEESRWEALKHATKAPEECVRPDVISTQLNEELSRDYLALDGRAKKRRKPSEGARSFQVLPDETETSSEDEIPEYRDTEERENPPNLNELTSENSFQARDGRTTQISPDHIRRLENARLSKVVEDDPGNLEAWLALIDYQENLVGYDGGTVQRRLTTAEKKSTADIKISMYEKALDKVGHEGGSRSKLLLGMMEEGAKIWDDKKQNEKWRAILRSNPQSSTLFNKYVTFQQTNLTTFELRATKVIYIECLHVCFDQIRSKANTEYSDSLDTIVVNAIYLLLRATSCLRDAGFSEESYGIWQALLEFNVFSPVQMQFGKIQSLESKTKRFREFWESETPRIGEPNARGFAYFVSHGAVEHVRSKTDLREGLSSEENPFQDWAHREVSLGRSSSTPAISTDDVMESDPYRVILFSDVEEFLCTFPQQAFTVLVDAFLAFCQFPSNFNLGGSSSHLQWWGDPFIRSGSGLILDQEVEPPMQFSLSFYRSTTETAFVSSKDWFYSWPAVSRMSDSDSTGDGPEWQSNTLQRLFDNNFGGAPFAEYFLSFQGHCKPFREAKRAAKAAIKRHPDSKRLYNCFALLTEKSKDAIDSAGIFEMASKIQRKTDLESQIDEALLWRTWASQTMFKGDFEGAVSILVSFGPHHFGVAPEANEEDRLVQQTDFLTRELGLFPGSAHQALCMDHLLLLAYLKPAGSFGRIAALNQIFTKFVIPLGSMPHVEAVHQTRARLLYYHIQSSSAYRPGDIRNALAESIALFPSNTMFLSVFEFTERRFRIDDRVRDILHRSRKRRAERNVCTASFAVYHEMVRAGSTPFAVRAAFEDVVAEEDSPARHSALVWEGYVRFSHANFGQKETKEVFYRGLRCLPWVKNYWMLAFDILRDSFTAEELRNLYRGMVEKGIRIRLDLEEELAS